MALTSLLLVAALTVAPPAQATEFPAPPMVPAGAPAAPPPPPPTPPPEPTTPHPGTPPPPSVSPNQPGNPAYGQPKVEETEKPPIEYGLMVSESLFGMLTAAGVALLPYFLLLRDFVEGTGQGVFGGNATVGTVIYLLIFAALPLSVAQTEVSIANGSRWYYSETWPAALVGLGAEGAVLGLAYLTRGPALTNPGPVANPYVLLVGTIGFVPLIQMVVMNLVKTSRFGKPGASATALFNYRDGHGVTVGVPQLAPVFSSNGGSFTGAQFSLLSGRF